MTINMNSKSSLIIAGSAAVAGGVIFGVSKLIDIVKSKKTKEEPAEVGTEEKTANEEKEKPEEK